MQERWSGRSRGYFKTFDAAEITCELQCLRTWVVHSQVFGKLEHGNDDGLITMQQTNKLILEWLDTNMFEFKWDFVSIMGQCKRMDVLLV